MNAKEKAKAGL
jgi:hypothetical protein